MEINSNTSIIINALKLYTSMGLGDKRYLPRGSIEGQVRKHVKPPGLSYTNNVFFSNFSFRSLILITHEHQFPSFSPHLNIKT